MKKSKLITIVGGSVVALGTALSGTYYATRPNMPQFSEQDYEKNPRYKGEYTFDYQGIHHLT